MQQILIMYVSFIIQQVFVLAIFGKKMSFMLCTSWPTSFSIRVDPLQQISTTSRTQLQKWSI